MRKIVRINLVVTIVACLLLLPDLAIAASGHGEGHAATFWDIKFFLINFTIYFIFIAIVARKNMPTIWKARRTSLEAAINSSRIKVEAIEKSIAAAKSKLANIETDLKSIKERSAQDTRIEISDIESGARQAIERMQQQTKDRLAAEEKALDAFIRKSYTEQALKIAEDKLKAAINLESDRAFRDNTLRSMKTLVQ